MNIALIGSRGVPAKYGGFETFYEELGKRLVMRGHSVTVYCRHSYYYEKLDEYLGLKLIYLSNLKTKSLDTLSHTFLSVLHAVGQPYDVYMVCNTANSPVMIIPRLLGKRIVINTDGLEWKRGKWGKFAQKYYKLSEWLSTKLANRIISDSVGIKDYYRTNYGIDSTYIAYGAPIIQSEKPELLNRYGLQKHEYFIQVTRFEPENNPLLTLRAFKAASTGKKLVLVGGVPYKTTYSRQIEMEADEDVILTGFVYDKEVINELWVNCFAYIHGNEVGGTNPALLQTMGAGCFTIAVDTPFSHDVLQDSGIYYTKTIESLSSQMKWACNHVNQLESYKSKAVERVRTHYTWDNVTNEYERLFTELVEGKYTWSIRQICTNSLALQKSKK
jgi:glycosyltransferase involved in cell wall biosynthesis